jgi:hypothetical protein
VAERHGTGDMVLLFEDTKSEDEDLYRFLDETAAEIGLPVIRVADGRDIWQVFKDEKFLGNSRVDPCSRILKRELARDWMKVCGKPDDTIYLGYDWTEVHRLERSQRFWAPWHVEAPMTEKPYISRTEMFAQLAATGIKAPRLYDLGLSHNNCGGGCVKAGRGHFTQLLQVFPARYAEWERNEEDVRQSLGKDVSILRDTDKNNRVPLTLKDLRERIEAGEPAGLWEVGGCACFEEPKPAPDSTGARE